jgi:ubiquitin-protein ligase
MATVKRVLKEYVQLEKEPLENIWIQTDESNILRCVCYFKINDQTHIPMVVLFPSDYPLKPPDVGFPIDFGYTNGASYFKSDGPLKGMLVICLDILGNFAQVHDEWARIKGSGWSPSYTLTSLLVNMQTVIIESIEEKSKAQLDQIKSQWERYVQDNSIQVPCFEKSKETQGLDLSKIADQELVQLIKQLEIKCGQFASEELGQLVGKIIENQNNSTSTTPGPKLDPEIFCWFTGANYTEDILGYGIQIKPQGKMQVLSTDGNYISWKAWKELGLRQYPTKENFDYFLPAWINQTHSVNSENWLDVLNTCIKQIGQALGITRLQDSIARIFPDLINTMVVKIMDSRSDLRASNVVFRCLLNLWRTSICLVDSNEVISKLVKDTVNKFITNKSSRTKTNTPNVGNMLALGLIVKPEQLVWGDFLQAFEEECGLRRVLWWRKGGIKLDPVSTYAQCKISRNNVLFQALLRSLLAKTSLNTLDELNCGLEGGVEVLLEAWKDIESRTETGTWAQYYTELKTLGLPDPVYQKIVSNIPSHIKGLITQAGGIPGY